MRRRRACRSPDVPLLPQALAMTDTATKTIPLAVVSGDAPTSLQPGVKQVAGDKISRSPVQFADVPVLRKPSWIRVRIPSGNAVQKLKEKLRDRKSGV